MSKVRKQQIQSIPKVNESGVVGRVFNATKERLDQAFGITGEHLDSFVSFRDLKDGGLATYDPSGGSGVILPPEVGGDPGGGFLTPPDFSDTEIPDSHQNVRTLSLWDGIRILWDWPQTGQFAYTEVYASTTPNFVDAVSIGTSPGSFFTHTGVGLYRPGDDHEQGQGERWYWIRWVGFTIDDETEIGLFTPNEGSIGIHGTTANDPEYVLDVLEGQITESQIFKSLNDRIDLVDCDPDNPNIIYSTCVQSRINLAQVKTATDIYAAISQNASIGVNRPGTEFGSEYSVRLDTNGYVVGFGISSLVTLNPYTGQNISTSSSFVVRAENFAVASPIVDEDGSSIIPFIVSTVGGVSTVGINGALVVDGTITANSIQAQTIGADQINANSVWTGLLEANRVIGNTIATSDAAGQYRVVISGINSNSGQYPIWFGKNSIGGSDSVFYFEQNGTLRLAGNLFVTGAGRFRTDEKTVQIGGGGFGLWCGPSTESPSKSNSTFYVDNNGHAFFGGTLSLPSGQLTVPSGTGSFDVKLPPGITTTQVAIVCCVVVSKNDNQLSAYRLEILVDNSVVWVEQIRPSLNRATATPVIMVSAGSGTIRATARLVRPLNLDGSPSVLNWSIAKQTFFMMQTTVPLGA